MDSFLTLHAHCNVFCLSERADVLCQLGRLKEALIMYSECSEDVAELSPERLRHFVDALSRDASATASSGLSTTIQPGGGDERGKSRGHSAVPLAGRTSSIEMNSGASKQLVADPWSCTSCLGVLCEPITLPCGHSICTSCVYKDKRNHPVCRKCGADYSRYNVKNARTNVLVKSLCQKYWGAELIVIKLRTKGNALFQEAKVPEAIAIYTHATELGKKFHQVHISSESKFEKDCLLPNIYLVLNCWLGRVLIELIWHIGHGIVKKIGHPLEILPLSKLSRTRKAWIIDSHFISVKVYVVFNRHNV